jgi:predicted flavoprotein YhiN
MVTRGGLEGGAVYQLNREILEEVGRAGKARLEIDLRPDLTFDDLLARLIRPRGKQSVSTWLRKAAALSPVAIGLLREVSPGGLPAAADDLAMLIKGLPLDASGLAGLSRAISTRGGVRLEDIGPDMQLAALPGVFVAGEMIDWDAPTGGYLLQGCFATGVVAGHGVLRHLGVVLATVQAENSQEKQIETERS